MPVSMAQRGIPPKNSLSMAMAQHLEAGASHLVRRFFELVNSREYPEDTSELEKIFHDLQQSAYESARTASLIKGLRDSCEAFCMPALNGPLESWGDAPLKAVEMILQKIAKQGYDDIQANELIRGRFITAFLGRLKKTESYYHLGCLLYLKTSEWDKTESLLNEARKEYPSSHVLALQHVKVLRRYHKWEEILRFVKSFQQAHGAHFGLAMQEGTALLATGRCDDGLSLLRPYIEQNAQVPPDQLLLIRIVYGLCLRRLRRWQPAEEQFVAAFDAGVESAGIHLANLQFETAQTQSAFEIFESLLDSSQALYAYMGMSRALRRLGRKVAADDMAKKALARQPGLLPALCDYAHLATTRGDSIEEVYNKVLSEKSGLIEEFGDSIFFANGVIWRLWPRNKEQQ